MNLPRALNINSIGHMGNAVGVRIALHGLVSAFLGVNLWYRFWTIFDYSRFVGGLFIFLGACSLVVILFPKLMRVFLFLFGASFFLFGFRAYDIQSQVFETVVVFVALTVFVVNIRRDTQSAEGVAQSGEREAQRTGVGDRLNRQLVGLILCYIGLSVLSLQLLPVGHVVKDYWFFGLEAFALQMANATPNTLFYPFGGINRLILFSVLAFQLANTENARKTYKLLFAGVFFGAVFCAFIGLLDFYGIISLAWYRFGKIISPGVLHSTFLNRGWFAEFVLATVPFVLIGFTSQIKGFWWKILLLGSLVVCEIALILAGARAGWLSYPLILFICWLFFYFFKEGRLESFHFRWRDILKVAVSVPITIGISFLLIFQVLMPLSDHLRNDVGIHGKGRDSKGTTERLKGRISHFTETGRIDTWKDGINVGEERPVFGMGYESYRWHVDILNAIPNSSYKKHQIHRKLRDTPHNIFIQLFVSNGLVGLCLWLVIMGYAVMILAVDLVRNKRLLNIPIVISIISFHIYGIFQSMQYIPMIWSLIFLCLGYAMTLDEKVLPERIRRFAGFVLKVMIFLVLVGCVVYFSGRGSRGLAEKYELEAYAKDQNWHMYHGFYHREKWGKAFYRWSGPRAEVKVEGSGIVEFDLQCHTPGVEKEPVQVIVSLDGERIDELWFNKKGSVKRQYYIGKKKDGAGHEFLFEVSRTWNPKKLGISEDGRDLGVAVSEPRLLKKMPKNGGGM